MLRVSVNEVASVVTVFVIDIFSVDASDVAADVSYSVVTIIVDNVLVVTFNTVEPVVSVTSTVSDDDIISAVAVVANNVVSIVSLDGTLVLAN